MVPLRCFSFVAILSSCTMTCQGDERATEVKSGHSVRLQLQPYLGWLPSPSETLLVLQEPFDFPAEPRNGGAFSIDEAFREMRLSRMFAGPVREELAGTRVKLWIEASSRFRLPEFPDEVKDVQLVGVQLQYDGCHVFVLEGDSSLDMSVLHRKLLLTNGDPSLRDTAAKLHRCEGHTAIEYSGPPPSNRTRGGRETPEQTALIESALSMRFWIAAPMKNVLIVATTRELLEQSLRNVEKSNIAAFPEHLDEWQYISGQMPLWGIRHFHVGTKPDPTDLSDIRRRDDHAIVGLAFEINPKEHTAKLTFLKCSPLTDDWAQSSIEHYVYPVVESIVKDDGTVVVKLDWSQESEELAQRIGARLSSWLLNNLGHAVII